MRRGVGLLSGLPAGLCFAIGMLTALPAPADPLRIVAFGDSTTAPLAGVSQVYPERLAALLARRGIEAEVINSGRPGSHTGRWDDTKGWKNRHALDRLQDAVRDHRPEIVIVQFGINDSWVDRGGPEATSRVPIEGYRANLTQIVRSLAGDGAQVIVMTPNPVRSDVERWRYQRLGRYAEVARAVARTLQTRLVDVWSRFEAHQGAEGQKLDDLLLDQVHPNDAGHRIIAELLAREILTLPEVAARVGPRSRRPTPD